MFASVTSPSRRKLVAQVYKGLTQRARRQGVITADDVHALLDKQAYPRSPSKRQPILKTLLNGSVFYNTGLSRPSSRPAAKSRRVSEWTY